MTTSELVTQIALEYQRNLDITKAKNNDYAGIAGDAFANFKLVELMSNGSISAEMGFITRMSDKLIRISNLIKQDAQVKTESIEDTLRDLANYSMLMLIYVRSKQLARVCNDSMIKAEEIIRNNKPLSEDY